MNRNESLFKFSSYNLKKTFNALPTFQYTQSTDGIIRLEKQSCALQNNAVKLTITFFTRVLPGSGWGNCGGGIFTPG